MECIAMPRVLLPLSLIIACLSLSPLYAADSPVAVASPASAVPASVSTIQKFVAADFDAQIAHIEHLPDNPADF